VTISVCTKLGPYEILANTFTKVGPVGNVSAAASPTPAVRAGHQQFVSVDASISIAMEAESDTPRSGGLMRFEMLQPHQLRGGLAYGRYGHNQIKKVEPEFLRQPPLPSSLHSSLSAPSEKDPSSSHY
jgi:hypothetical protein